MEQSSSSFPIKVGQTADCQDDDLDRSGTRRDFLAKSAVAAGGLAAAAVAGSPSTALADRVFVTRRRVSITHWTWSWPTSASQKAATLKGFKKVAPNVNLQVKLYTYPTYLVALSTGIPNHATGEVLAFQTGSNLIQYSRFLTPLNSLAEKELGRKWEKGFVSTSLSECLQGQKEKTYYALPYWFSLGGLLWYNQTLFDQVGVAVPTTYSELAAAAAKFNSAGITPIAGGFADKWPLTDYLIMFTSQFRPNVLADAELGEHGITFLNPAIVQGMEFFQQTVHDNVWEQGVFGDTAFPGAYNLFDEGKAAMVEAGTWYLGALTGSTASVPQAQDNWGAMLFPHIADAPNSDWLGKRTFSSPGPKHAANPSRPWHADAVTLGIPKGLSASKASAAWSFVEWMVSKKGNETNISWATPAQLNVKVPGLNARWANAFSWMNSLGNDAEWRNFLYPATQPALETAIANVCVNGADVHSELATVQRTVAAARKK